MSEAPENALLMPREVGINVLKKVGNITIIHATLHPRN
jgi:hypothetical protein